MNPDKSCNFDCVYCEVNRAGPGRQTVLDTQAMAAGVPRDPHRGAKRPSPGAACLLSFIRSLAEIAARRAEW